MRLRDQWLAVGQQPPGAHEQGSQQGNNKKGNFQHGAIVRAPQRFAPPVATGGACLASSLQRCAQAAQHIAHHLGAGLGSGSSRSMRSLSLPASLMCLFF